MTRPVCGSFREPDPRTGETGIEIHAEGGGRCTAPATHLVGIYDTIPMVCLCEPCARVLAWDDESIARLNDDGSLGAWGVW